MICFEKLIGEIYRLKVPFEDIYTAVFLVRSEEGDLILDCATTKEDAEKIIIPALEAVGAKPKYAVCTHFHSDHMGGLPYILSHYEGVKAVFCHKETAEKHPEWDTWLLQGGELLFGCLRVLSLPGHSDDSIGLLDIRSGTLLSGDCIQLGGVGRYGTGIADGEKYRDTLDKLLDTEFENLITSHEYYPLGSIAMGRENVERYIAKSLSFADEIACFAKTAGASDCGGIARLYNEHYSDRPPISGGTVKALSASFKA